MRWALRSVRRGRGGEPARPRPREAPPGIQIQVRKASKFGSTTVLTIAGRNKMSACPPHAYDDADL
jgi:hypothetical protein